MNNCKFSVSAIVVPSILVIHLVNDAQLLNATCVARLQPAIVILPHTKM